MGDIMNNEYEKDYVLEALMQDKALQSKKHRKRNFDFRRTTKAHQGNMSVARKRIEKIH